MPDTTTLETTVFYETIRAQLSSYVRPEQLQQRYYQTLSNAKNPEILAFLRAFNFDEARINEGIVLHNNVCILMSELRQKNCDLLDTSVQLMAIFGTARELFITTRIIAREALGADPAAVAMLDLVGKTKRTISGFAKQASTFYTNILGNPLFLEKMSWFGYTDEKLESEQRLISEILDTTEKRRRELGDSPDTSNPYEMAFERLDDWMSNFYTVATIALKKHPELLRLLGL